MATSHPRKLLGVLSKIVLDFGLGILYNLHVPSDKQRLEASKRELARLLAEREERDRRIAVLRQTIGRLGQSMQEDGSVDRITSKILTEQAEMKLLDAVKEAIQGFRVNEHFTPLDIKAALERMYWDVNKYTNVMATIHRTLERLAESGELIPSIKDDKKGFKRPSRYVVSPWLREYSR